MVRGVVQEPEATDLARVAGPVRAAREPAGEVAAETAAALAQAPAVALADLAAGLARGRERAATHRAASKSLARAGLRKVLAEALLGITLQVVDRQSKEELRAKVSPLAARFRRFLVDRVAEDQGAEQAWGMPQAGPGISSTHREAAEHRWTRTREDSGWVANRVVETVEAAAQR